MLCRLRRRPQSIADARMWPRSPSVSTTTRPACARCCSRPRARSATPRPPYRDAFVAIDEQWGDAALLAHPQAGDAELHRFLSARRPRPAARRGRRDRRRPPENAVHVDVLVRTFVVSASVTLICLLLGYPLGGADRAFQGRRRQHAADPGAAAVLDVAAGAHQRLGRPAAEPRRGQFGADLGGPHRSRAAARADLQPHRRAGRHDAHPAAVHGAADLQRHEEHPAGLSARRLVARRAADCRPSGGSICR